MNNRLLTLDRGDLVEFADAPGTTLRVTTGRLWVTQERDRRDYVLEAGDAWTIERPGLTVAEAQSDAAVVVVGGNLVDARVRSHGMHWQTRLASGFERNADLHLRRNWVPHL